MKGDFSRFSFDKKKRYSAVLMQQGRLQLDSDWNEQVQISEHRNTAFFRDLVGRSGTPAGNAMTLRLNGEAGKLTLTRGVCYIDGLFVENDRALELKPEALPEGDGEFLYYVDAWTREVNASEDGELVDPAIGVDTTTRLKTEWKLRWRKMPEPPQEKEAWKQLFGAGRWPEAGAELPASLTESNWWWPMSTGEMKLSSGIVKLKDNRLYRVEIHDGNPAVRFKWSRDNAFVCAEVHAKESGYKLENNSVPMQDAFKGAAWIELCTPEEAGVLLDMKKSVFAGGELKPSQEETEALGVYLGKLKEEKLIIRRWDGVFLKGEKENSLKAELGVEVEHSEGFYRSGDYWLLLIRGREVLNWKGGEPKPPEGVAHHFAALASVSLSKGQAKEPESWHLHFNPLTSPNLTAESELNVEKLTVRGASALEGNAHVGTPAAHRTLTVHGAASVSGVLTVSGTGSSSIAGPLALSGNATVGTASANRTLTVHGAASVSGAFTAGSTASIAGNTTLSGNLQGTTGSFSAPASPMELLLLGVTPQRLTFDSGIADKKTVELFSKASWSASVNPEANWCTVAPTSGNGNATPTVSVSENTGTVRTAAVTFTSGGHTRMVNVTQPPLLAPVISGFMPSAAQHSTPLTIFGANFNLTPANNVVKLNGIAATVTAVTAMQLTVMVPKNRACSGKITVTVGSKTATSSAVFEYTDTAQVSILAGDGTTALFHEPWGLALHPAGNLLYVVDKNNHRIRTLTLPGGTVGTLASGFNNPHGIAVDIAGNIYVSDTGNHCIRRVTPAGVVSTFAGAVGAKAFADGALTVARFDQPAGIAIDAAGSLYVADFGNNRIRKISLEGAVWKVSTIAGSGTAGFADSDSGANAQFHGPWGIAVDAKGDNVFVSDRNNHRIRRVISRVGAVGVFLNSVTTFAGSSNAGYADGVGTAAQFTFPRDIAIDRSGNVYVTVPNISDRIRKITPQGVVSTIAGSTHGFRDGAGPTAQFDGLVGVIIDSSGKTLYVAEMRNHCIRKIELE